MRATFVLALSSLILFACEEKKEPAAETAEQPAAAVEPAAVVQPAKAEPAVNAEEKQAADEAKAEQQAVEDNPLTPCCRELGRKGFMDHSPEYMAASKECGEAMTAGKAVADAQGAIKTALKGKALPESCNP